MPFCWLDKNEALKILTDAAEGRLATCDNQGQPYITPLNYVYHEGKIYFHSKCEGRKLSNIAVNNKVCFEVSRPEKFYYSEQPCSCGTRYTSVLVFGTAKTITNEDAKIKLLTLITEKYIGGRPFKPIDPVMAASCCVMEITVDEISGKRNIDPQVK